VRDLERYRAATHKVHNRAVFEMPGILQGILAQAEARVTGEVQIPELIQAEK
jgi:hypothetical protein